MELPSYVGRLAHAALLLSFLVFALMLARVDRPEPAILHDLAVSSTQDLQAEATEAADRMHQLVEQGVRDEQQLLAAARADHDFGCTDFYHAQSADELARVKEQNARHRCIGKVSLVAVVVEPQELAAASGAGKHVRLMKPISVVLLRAAVSHRYILGFNEQAMPLDKPQSAALVSALTGELSDKQMQKMADRAVKNIDASLAANRADEDAVIKAAQEVVGAGCVEYFKPEDVEQTEKLRKETSHHPCPGQLGLSIIVLEPQALSEQDAQLAQRIETSKAGAAAFVIVHPIVSMQPVAAISSFVR